MHYVVYWVERLRDGQEEGARIVGSKEAAAKFLNDLGGGFFGKAMEFKLFELGREIPIMSSLVVEEQPPKTKVKWDVS